MNRNARRVLRVRTRGARDGRAYRKSGGTRGIWGSKGGWNWEIYIYRNSATCLLVGGKFPQRALSALRVYRSKLYSGDGDVT